METHLTYNDKKYKILGHIEHGNGTLSVDLKPVPELPEEPPEGTILVDDAGRPWWRQGGWWFSSRSIAGRLLWKGLLSRSDLRNVLVAGKATDSLVRFKTSTLVHEKSNYPDEAPHYYSGFSFDEAPVHGYFKQVPGE